ncbi:PREDICTED: probable L-type lectin-domain containing receptor kinase V.3 [Camelina sativa]|uniref:Probable L-type lectin-domain containing receptor kinase V.3 n=1 Tax=Camelina sativa TaxID=90675 RepID=A0ABM0SLK8_CAMSA|nr:PREDICTED: probable L-type lectin-domain containing receptor kinase V.3 [Camelina sativa]
MLISHRIIHWIVFVVFLFCCSENSHGKLIMEGSAGYMNGFTTLTNTKKHAYGQAFDDNPFPFKNSNGTMNSFSFTFFFAIVPEHKNKGSHGMAFVISPTRGIPGAFADQYLGIFNDANNGKSSNQIISVEVDIHKDDEFGDIDDNHIGININGMRSNTSAPAGYYDEKGQFKNISLVSGKLLRITILYSHIEKLLVVMLSPAEEAILPKRPLLSLKQDLSPYLSEYMYVGFTASTGSVGAIHYLWVWYQYTLIIVPQLDFLIPTFPPYPKTESLVKRIVLVTCLTLALIVALAASALSIFFYKRHKKVVEVLEEWEIECGPHRFAYKELSKATNGFKQLLGKGGFGQVFKGTLPGSAATIAVKRVSHGSSQGMREFLAEIATIGRLRHPNLVRLLGYCRYKEELYLVYDFMPNGSLDKYLYGGSDQEQLSWTQRFKIIKDVASALSYLHHEWVQVVIHRDIKPANVLIDDKMNASLGDFGLAKLYDQGYDPQTSRVAGTFGYMAPELMRTGRPTTGTDVYAFGVFMLEVSCGRKLFEPRAEPEEVVLADWAINRWENGDIVEAVNESIRPDPDEGQLELVLKLGVLCSHQAEEVRPDMATVVKILDGVSELPDNLLDIVRTEKLGKWYETYKNVLDTEITMESAGNLTITEPMTSVGR